jgi:hypothetical protein
MTQIIPEQPVNSFRITLNLVHREPRMDNILLSALRSQDENPTLKIVSRGALKTMFQTSKIMIKGQRAKSSSSLAKGTTYVDILLG